MENNYNGVKIYSIGASNEEHGPGLPVNIDDFFAKRVSVNVAERLRADYIGHLPYSSDRVGEIARDWNHSYIEMDLMIDNIVKDVERDKNRLVGKFSHCIIISGHGGNNFLNDHSDKIGNMLEIPFLYISPLAGIRVLHPEHDAINPSHADDCEHSIARFLGVLNENGFEKLNIEAKKHPINVLKKWPALMGLAGYVLPELGGERYTKLREYCGEENGRLFLQRRSIIADYDVGKEFVDRNVYMAFKEIKKFFMD
ncbi:MAG: hypothetical protein Q7S27_05335 [Nanoarchaeota archaeon]|nr:hypothetical protein [Nanoarchaeota archaeon]